MTKFYLSCFFTISFFCADAQVDSNTKSPIFPECATQESTALETCFYDQVQDLMFKNFVMPQDLPSNYTGFISILFEVDAKGVFKVLYVDGNEIGLATETKRVFKEFPTIQPATYHGRPTYAKYTYKIAFPLQSAADVALGREKEKNVTFSQRIKRERDLELPEYDSIIYKKFDNPQFKSHLNIPFSHSYYAKFDAALNQLGANNHTASKPFTYNDVSKYYNLEAVNKSLMKSENSWIERKLWNENFVEIQGEGYWFTLNPILDLQIGKNSSSDIKYTFVNTRGIQINGGLGEQLNFTTTIFESQGRFADYYNRYAESIKADGSNPAIIPGIGISKRFKTDSYDFPLAEANIAFTPSRFLNLNLGYGRNFIGDGYRSLLLSDGASPYPYVKLNTTFWKIKYTNVYTWLKDVRTEVLEDRTYASKFSASHYLSWNATKRLNIGLFESVVWSNDNNRGFDMSFVNPIIFYRSVEFASSSRSGNALLALTSKYKVNNQINVYGQFLVDEFALDDVKAANKSWRNKFGYQIGAKYFNAFNIENLLLQVEYNVVRPYVYAHSEPITNYGHNNQSLGHNWSANFKELIGIGRYHKGRYFADAKFTYGKRGFDFDKTIDPKNYGGDIYLDYDNDRPFNTGVKAGQGNTTNVFIADVQAGYLINPASNMKVFASVIYRNFDPLQETATIVREGTTWFSVGVRCDIFNWYFDY